MSVKFSITRPQVMTMLGQAYSQADYDRVMGPCQSLYIVQNNHENFEQAFIFTALVMESAIRHQAGNFDTIDLDALSEHLK
jgi:hypothetical protein